jgi:hypothetical protein
MCAENVDGIHASGIGEPCTRAIATVQRKWIEALGATQHVLELKSYRLCSFSAEVNGTGVLSVERAIVNLLKPVVEALCLMFEQEPLVGNLRFVR